MTDDVDVRRRRAAYRATHRGTREMDTLLGRFAEARLHGLAGDDLACFERLLAVADPTLQAWIFATQSAAGSEFEAMIEHIRAFHGFDAVPKATA